MTAPHDEPGAQALIEAVRQFLADEVEPQTEGRLRYHLKVAANVLAIVERELQLGAAQSARHAERLVGLGVRQRSGTGCCAPLGRLDERLKDLEEPLREMVADKLAVARPGYASRG